MANPKLQFLITAKDVASSVIEKVSEKLFNVRNAVVALGAAAAGAVGLSRLGGFLSDALQASQDAEERFKRLEGVIEATGGAAGLSAEEIRQFASDLDEATLGSQVEIERAAAQMLTFRTVTGDTFKQAITLAQDLSDVFGSVEAATLQIGKALDNPAQGFAALRRSGVSFSDTQIELIKNFQEMGDIASAQGVILETLAGQVEGVASAAGGGLAGSVDLVGKKFLDLQVAIGDAILPAAIEFYNNLAARLADLGKEVDELTESGQLQRWFADIGASLGELTNKFFDFVRDFDFNAALQGVSNFADGVVETVGKVDAVFNGLVSSAKTVGNTITGVFNAAGSATSAVILSISQGVQRFIDTMNLLRLATDETKASVDQFVTDAQANFDSFTDAAVQDAQDFKDGVMGIVDSVTELAAATDDANQKQIDAQQALVDTATAAQQSVSDRIKAEKDAQKAYQDTLTAIEEQKTKIEELDEAITRSLDIPADADKLTGLYQQLGQETQELNDLLVLEKTLAEDVAKALADGMNDANKSTQDVKKSIGDVKTELEQSKQAFQDALNTGGIISAANEWRNLKAVADEYTAALEAQGAEGQQELQKINAELAKLFRQTFLTTQATEQYSEALGMASDSAEGIAEKVEDIGASADSSAVSVGEISIGLTQAEQRAQDLLTQMEAIDPSTASGAAQANRLAFAMNAVLQSATLGRQQVEALGDETLQSLRTAIVEINSGFDEMSAKAGVILRDLQDRLDRLQGDEGAIRQRQQLQEQLELQTELNNARASGNRQAISDLSKSLQLLREIQDIENVQATAQTSRATATTAAAPTTASTGGITVNIGGVLDKNNVIDLNDPASLDSLVRAIAPYQDAFSRRLQ